MNEYEVISDKVFGYVYADDFEIDEKKMAIFYRNKKEVKRIPNIRSVEMVEDIKNIECLKGLS